MEEFEVGDKIRRVARSHSPSEFGEVGNVYTVLSIKSKICPVVIEGQPGADPNAFELVEKGKQMAKFKIGDKVKIIANTNYSCNKIGDVGTIVSFNNGYWRVEVEGRAEGNWTKESEMELVMQAQDKYEVGKWYPWDYTLDVDPCFPRGTKVNTIKFAKSEEKSRSSNFEYFNFDSFWNNSLGYEKVIAFKVVSYPKTKKSITLELTEAEIATVKSVLGKVKL